jgi:histidyl-tRNA synthetase
LKNQFEVDKVENNLQNFYAGKDSLDNILKFTKTLGCENQIEIDVSLARGLSYYTGAIFEINVPDLAGSLGGGGRYDGLVGMFGKEQIPACGFSLGLERILVVMEERGMFQKLADEGKLKLDSADVLVTVWNEDAIGESLKLAGELRAKNLRVLVYPEADKLGKQFKYADSLGVKTAIILREEEINENKVKVKNLQTGEEDTFARDELTADIASGKF